MNSEYLSTKEVSALLGVPVHTLKSWRGTDPQGPEYIKVGKRLVRYPKSSLESWLKSSTVYPESSDE